MTEHVQYPSGDSKLHICSMGSVPLSLWCSVHTDQHLNMIIDHQRSRAYIIPCERCLNQADYDGYQHGVQEHAKSTV